MKQSQSVLLGVPGDLIEPPATPSAFGTKAGGSPVVLKCFPQSCFDAARCGVCGSQLGLVLQVAASDSRGLALSEGRFS